MEKGGRSGKRTRAGRRGRATRPRHPDRPCLNCGDPTPGEYCPTCGQRKVDVQVSVRAMAMDVLEDQFILGARLPRTLKGLLFRPGFLTVEHVNGRIARYVQPIKLYLVASIVFFLFLSFLSLRLIERAEFGPGPGARGAAVDAATDSAALVGIDSALADPNVPEAVKATLRATRAPIAARMARQASGAAEDTSASPPPDAGPGSGELDWMGDIRSSTGIAAVDSAVTARLRRLSRMEQREAIQTIVGDFMRYVPTLMFILLPIFALVLKLLYIRRGRFYAEHFVFLLHTHAFVYIIFTMMLLFRQWTAGWVQGLLVVWTFAYILLAMKRVYAQGWIRTFLKYWTLGWAYFWIFVLTIPLAFIATVLLLPG